MPAGSRAAPAVLPALPALPALPVLPVLPVLPGRPTVCTLRARARCACCARCARCGRCASRPRGPFLIWQLKGHTERTLEYLRYFYACFPAPLQPWQPAARERVGKLHDAIAQHSTDLKSFKKELKPTGDPKAVAAAGAILRQLQALLRLCATAEEKYANDGPARPP